MDYLSGDNELTALEFIVKTVEIARQATCLRSKCGSIIVKDKEIIGFGFNHPPLNLESQRRCNVKKDSYSKKVTDKTCCIHAEQQAMFDALEKNPGKLAGSRLYFVRLDKEGAIRRSGKPYCTICSKMALNLNIAEFVLFHEEGVCVYNTQEYNDLSFRYLEQEEQSLGYFSA